MGILIPPSVVLIVMGPVLGVSVAKLYAAASDPGFLLSFMYIAYLLLRSYINPKLGPPLSPEEHLQSTSAKMREFLAGMLPLGILIAGTFGGILGGLATPTEATSMGVVGSLILAMGYKKLSWQKLRRAAIGTMQTSSMVILLGVASNVFGAVFARLGSADLTTKSLLSLLFSSFIINCPLASFCFI